MKICVKTNLERFVFVADLQGMTDKQHCNSFILLNFLPTEFLSCSKSVLYFRIFVTVWGICIYLSIYLYIDR